MAICNCVGEVREKIRKATKDPEAVIQVVLSLWTDEAYPALTFSHRRMKPDGTFTKTVYDKTIMPTFCPFCGKKYDNHSCEGRPSVYVTP